MKKYTFTWKESEFCTVVISEDDLIGKRVMYIPMDEEGVVQRTAEGEVIIAWDDGTEHTYLNTPHGKSVLSDCKPL